MSVQTSNPAATAIVGIDLVGATVPDLQRSLAFYRDALGMIPAVEHESGAEFHFPDGTTFGLWQPPADFGMKPGFGVMFSVNDVQASAEQMNKRGAGLGEVSESPVCFMSMGKDSEGNGTMLHHRKTPDAHQAPAQAPTPTTIRGIDLAGYLVTDPDRATAFYRDVLGLVPTDIDEEGRGAEFTLADGSTFGVWRTDDAAQSGFVMFAVRDANAKTAELRRRGVEIGEVMELPNCLMSLASDPDGNAVIIHQRKNT
jgi:predicted enzyme related to lactoylglutathione lyase